ncbi:MAG TPA: tetratricopeptide repeat protein [Thermoanaerobaculia bacterium]|nr:tetratricopeptide repeat protein [Thermoanaerobaculia bacterium]HUM31120.1 tetratricopeptide repeat protein [Thermoanaerobaculia bacterium]HXK69481.1 tetratricopeptide repeat protein [Thermoanaerobaculia bacterium]
MARRKQSPAETTLEAPEEVPVSKFPRVIVSAALILVFLMAALLSIREIGSPDIGFHLRVGESILSGHGWPANDTFTFTRTDQPYVDTSWGFQLLASSIYRLAGPEGLVLGNMVLVLLLFFLIHRTVTLYQPNPTISLLLLGLGVVASETRFKVRPEMVSYLLLALLLYILHRHSQGRKAPLFLLPVIFLLWINLHALFVLGWVVLVFMVAGGWLTRKKPDRSLLTWSALCFPVTLINPYGWKGVLFPFTLLMHFDRQGIFAESISELVSPFDFHYFSNLPFYPFIPINFFRILVILSVFSLLPLLRRRQWTFLMLWAPFLYLSVKMVRNIPLFVIVCLPMVALGLSSWSFRLKVLRKPAIRVAVPLILVVVLAGMNLRVITGAYYIGSRRHDRFGCRFNTLMLPVRASDYAKEAGFTGPMLNSLGYGGYLMWDLKIPVFIDGRLEVMGEDFYRMYKSILSSPTRREQIVEQYEIQWAVFSHAEDPDLLLSLFRDSQWRLVYVDGLSVIFLRSGWSAAPEMDRTLDSQSTGTGEPLRFTDLPGFGNQRAESGLHHWLQGFFHHQSYPFEDYRMGFFHLTLGELYRAEQRFSRAISESKGAYWEPYYYLGETLQRQGKKESARLAFLEALKRAPDYPLIVKALSALGKGQG